MRHRCKQEWQHCHSYLSNFIISEIKGRVGIMAYSTEELLERNFQLKEMLLKACKNKSARQQRATKPAKMKLTRYKLLKKSLWVHRQIWEGLRRSLSQMMQR